MPSGGNCIQVFCKRVLSDSINNVDRTDTVGEALAFFHEVLLRVDDHVVCSYFLYDLRFCFAGNGPNHTRAQMLCPLREQQSHSAGSSMNQNRIALLDLVELKKQIMGCHPLQRKSSALLEGKLLR